MAEFTGAVYPSRNDSPGPGRELGLFARSAGKKYLLCAGAGYEDITLPLAFEPDTSFAYSLGLDHAGELISRLMGRSLEDIFQAEIFRPLGLSSLSLFPDDSNRAMECVLFDSDTGGAQVIRGDVWGKTNKKADVTFQSGGSGLYGTAADFLSFLQAILRSDPRARCNAWDTGFLSAESFQDLFHPSLNSSPHCDSKKRGLAALLQRDEHLVDHSIGFVLEMTDNPAGRRKGSGSWYGAALTHFWLDPETGVAVSGGYTGRGRQTKEAHS
jgi:methyl acetate hydrolase